MQRRLGHAGRVHLGLRLPQQPPGAPHQHHSHDQKLHHQRHLGQRQADAPHLHQPGPHTHRLELGNQQRRHKRAGNRAHAAHHHHHKGCANGVQVHVELGGLARQLQRAGQARQQSAQRKHAGEQPGLVDAQGAHHAAVLRGCAHQRAPARAVQAQPQQAQHQRAHRHQKQVIGRELPAQNFDRPLQPRRTRPEKLFGAPGPQHGILDHEHQRESGQQLKKLGRAIDAPQEHHLHQRPQCRRGQRCQQQRRPKTDGGAQVLHQRIRHVDAQHEK